MKRKHIDYQEYLIDSLKDPEEAQAYLKAALMDEDQRIFLIALKNVIEAQGNSISNIAKRAKLNRESLYRMLSKNGNPRLTSIRSLLHEIGLELSLQPYK